MRLKPSPWRLLLLLAISSSFAALGIFLISRGEQLGGWLCTVLFGLGALVAIVSLLPGSSYLDLSSSGMEIRTLYRRWFVRWKDVHEFYPVVISNRKMVGWDYSASYSAQSLGRKISRGMSGAEAGLPDTYGMSAESLARLLNEWRIRHGSAP